MDPWAEHGHTDLSSEGGLMYIPRSQKRELRFRELQLRSHLDRKGKWPI